MNFEIVPGDPSSPYVIHVPHSSTTIPHDVRAQILLDDDALAQELRLMTDARTDELAVLAANRVAPRPWLFLNRLSRLVVDPERLPDDHEVMVEVGMGAVYTRTSGGLGLRDDDEQVRHALLSRFLTPYEEAMADLVDERIAATGRAIVIDLHSYPLKALPCERYQDARRPPVCVGVDFDHTPAALVERVSRACSVIGDIVVNGAHRRQLHTATAFRPRHLCELGDGGAPTGHIPARRREPGPRRSRSGHRGACGGSGRLSIRGRKARQQRADAVPVHQPAAVIRFVRGLGNMRRGGAAPTTAFDRGGLKLGRSSGYGPHESVSTRGGRQPPARTSVAGKLRARS